MALAPGTKIGPYDIVARLGEGGMGEVYRARDPRLNRNVAIKVLHASVANDPERLQRFAAEAQAVAALNHPNVLTVYETGTHDGHPFMATELIEGETLRARLSASPLPLSKAIDFARQAATGLAAAHARGIVHRDIKPDNLFVTSDGRLKILDFGLAKARGPAAATPEEESTVIAPPATDAGVVLGTVGYMSPEQVRAKPVDHRTDIFSLGVVLYEMLTGRRPFSGDSAVETMNAILTVDPPDPALSSRSIAPALAEVVRHCLEKNREERFQSARDLAFALQATSASTNASGSAAAVAPAATTDHGVRAQWLALVAAGIAGAAVAAFALLATRPAAPAFDLSTYRFTPFATDVEAETVPRWSPDGRSVAYLKDLRLFVRGVDDSDAVPVPTGNLLPLDIFWFPDNTRLGLVRPGGVWAVSRAGGDPERLQSGATISAATISRDGNTLAMWRVTTEGTRQSGALWFASPINAPPVKYEEGLLDLQGFSPNFLEYSPDGRRLLYSGYTPEPGLWLIPIGADGRPSGPPARALTSHPWLSVVDVAWRPDSRSLLVASDNLADQPGLWLADLDRQSVTKITAGVERLHQPSVSPDGGRILVAAGAVDYDVIGIPLDASPVAEVLSTTRYDIAATWTPSRSDGEFAYVTNTSGAAEIRLRQSDGRDRRVVGPRSFPGEPAAELFGASMSPDGTRVLFSRFDGKNASVWIAPVAGGAPARVGPTDVSAWTPAWSHDGKEIAYSTSALGSGARVFKQRLGSTEPPLTLIDAIPSVFGSPMEWSPVGDVIAHDSQDGLALVSADGKTRRVLVPQRARAIAWAPDGRTIYALTRNGPVDLLSVDVATGQSRPLRRLDPSLAPAVPVNPGLRMSLNRAGTMLLTTVARDRSDLWMLELSIPAK